jgi:MSHA biogenesis protein MshG
MPHFAYRGRDAQGELVSGILENSDSGAVADQLLATGVSPIEIRASAAPRAAAGESLLARLNKPKVTTEDLLLFSRQMHALLKAGVPILRALAGLEESATRESMVPILRAIRADLDSGRDVSTALRRHPEVFSPFYVSMVRIGEMTGGLEESFLRLFHHIEFEKEMRERVVQAVRYPVFVITFMGVALVIVNLFVIPAFAKLFAGFHTQLPLMTRILLGFSQFTVNLWYFIVAGLALAYGAFRYWRATPQGRYKWDRFIFRVPIAGKIILRATLARFARALSVSLRSGVPVIQALTVVAQVVENKFIGARVEQMRDGVERGESMLRTAAATGVFTPVVLQMIAVGEESGDLDGLLSEVADMYQREVEYDLKGLSAQIEPILIVILGILVTVLALGVFLPIWDLGQASMSHGGS